MSLAADSTSSNYLPSQANCRICAGSLRDFDILTGRLCYLTCLPGILRKGSAILCHYFGALFTRLETKVLNSAFDVVHNFEEICNIDRFSTLASDICQANSLHDNLLPLCEAVRTDTEVLSTHRHTTPSPNPIKEHYSANICRQIEN
ncbi:hypothetical protein SNK03_13552 [Fusarium graminearum]|uniref:Chromosome 1, complete genome n=1 Tax=Gibberella zeae (strain ATCC MYA-4620 / CBS 123657 / FGSC 9075 / NRRL 31084 / PH-1) TaxID=229533 RepID=I1S4M0_GIBZE|nr:hypothetical protein FGSG_11788 [Fusarium graminearum PH-1]ESU05787.1 hypothetical protein FGSG_11788 [Fusarium graminearum PH-1]CEF72546.1 unnamed protein product [Fusarium graminearum]CZS75810.1 unnamed protein product [Fusarium graminearum]|eukprot:XP_011316272.1 hypothetical protein FGSG_11788 [Fusarium graminearum PH-1]